MESKKRKGYRVNRESHKKNKKQPSEVIYKKGVLKNFAKFIGEHLCQSHFLIKRLWHRCFPENFAKFLRTPFSVEQLRWLLLKNKFLTSVDNLR